MLLYVFRVEENYKRSFMLWEKQLRKLQVDEEMGFTFVMDFLARRARENALKVSFFSLYD